MEEFLFRGISNEEKVHLRQKLLTHLREENNQVSFKSYISFYNHLSAFHQLLLFTHSRSPRHMIWLDFFSLDTVFANFVITNMFLRR